MNSMYSEKHACGLYQPDLAKFSKNLSSSRVVSFLAANSNNRRQHIAVAIALFN